MAQQPSNDDSIIIREYSRSNTHDGQRSRVLRAKKEKSNPVTNRGTGHTTSSRPLESSQESKEGYSFFGFWNRQKPKVVEPKTILPESTTKHPNGSVIDLDDYFLQPAEESRIERDVNQLKLFISSHVDDHYSGLTNPPPNETISDILAKDNEALPFAASLLEEERVRLFAIKHSIARHIIECIAFDSVNSDFNTTFLPDDLISLLEMIPRPHDRVQFAASAQLRRIAANLLQLNQRAENVQYVKQRDYNIAHVSKKLYEKFSALAGTTSSNLERREQLEAIMRTSAQFGALLLSQPATYQFEWTSPVESSSSSLSTTEQLARSLRKKRRFVVFPALVKIGDSSGRPMRRPEVLCEAEYEE